MTAVLFLQTKKQKKDQCCLCDQQHSSFFLLLCPHLIKEAEASMSEKLCALTVILPNDQQGLPWQAVKNYATPHLRYFSGIITCHKLFQDSRVHFRI